MVHLQRQQCEISVEQKESWFTMAGASSAVTLVPKGQEPVDPEMDAFLSQVQMVQSLSDIAAMSGPDHIARLHRPGAKYFNM